MIEHIKSVREVFVDTPKRHKLLTEQLKTVDDETQDLLHVLELGKLDAIKTGEVAKRLKKVQKERRQIKDDLEVMEEVVGFAKGRVNENTISKLIGDVRKIEKRKKTRKYRMRVCKDLEDYIV